MTPRRLDTQRAALLCGSHWTPQTPLVLTASHTRTRPPPNTSALRKRRNLGSFSSGGSDPPGLPTRETEACLLWVPNA